MSRGVNSTCVHQQLAPPSFLPPFLPLSARPSVQTSPASDWPDLFSLLNGMRADWLRRRCRHAAKRGFYWRFLPVSDTCRASGTRERPRERERERNQTGGRSIIASLPSLVISSAPSPSFIFFSTSSSAKKQHALLLLLLLLGF